MHVRVTHHQRLQRSDACLVVWADGVNTVMPIWHDITFRLQSQLVHPNTMLGLPGNTYDIDELLHPNTFDIHPAQHGGFTQLPTDSLSSLSELSFLEMVPLPNAPSPTLDNYQYPDPTTWLWGDNTSPGMGLLQVSPPKETHERPAVHSYAARTADAKHVRAVDRQWRPFL